jgi:hypothetical protein
MALLSRYHQQNAAEQGFASLWAPERILLPVQLAVHNDNARLRLVDGSRRCGKSFFAAVELTDTALKTPRAKCLFLALTRDDARDLVWATLLELNDDYNLGGVVNEVRLEITYPNGAVVRCGGAKDRRQAERRRGRFYTLVIIDECQLFPSHLRELVEQILKPALLGRGRSGRIILMGTPAETPGVGYWEQRVADPHWSKHAWTLKQNTHLGSPADIEAFLDEMARDAGNGNVEIGRQSAGFRREYLGERPPANDNDRPFAYDPAVNDFGAWTGATKRVAETSTTRDGRRLVTFTRWELPIGGTWRFTFGIDLGSRAASAVIVLGTSDLAPGKVWLVEEFLSTRMLPDKLRDKIEERRRLYQPNLMAVDEGALGDMIADQWRAPPYSLPVVAADKLAAEVTADFMSAAMSRGDFFLPAESIVAQDMAVLRWDMDYLEKRGKRKVANQPHSDAVPACRYAFKDAHALAQATRPPKPIATTVEAKLDVELDRERREGAKRASRTMGMDLMRGRIDAFKR